MNFTHTPSIAEQNIVSIYSYYSPDAHMLVEVDTRQEFELAPAVIEWLNGYDPQHKLTVDRGDIGEGAPHFHIGFSSRALADAFIERYRRPEAEDLYGRSVMLSNTVSPHLIDGSDLNQMTSNWLTDNTPEVLIEHDENKIKLVFPDKVQRSRFLNEQYWTKV